MKGKIKEFFEVLALRVKFTIATICILVAIVAGIIAEMWPVTKFNYPMLVCVGSMILFFIMIKSM